MNMEAMPNAQPQPKFPSDAHMTPAEREWLDSADLLKEAGRLVTAPLDERATVLGRYLNGNVLKETLNKLNSSVETNESTVHALLVDALKQQGKS